jgi:hypothetical protein
MPVIRTASFTVTRSSGISWVSGLFRFFTIGTSCLERFVSARLNVWILRNFVPSIRSQRRSIPAKSVKLSARSHPRSLALP